MYYWGVKYKKKITVYSKEFETVLDACNWYVTYGIKLIKMFDRNLILVKK